MIFTIIGAGKAGIRHFNTLTALGVTPDKIFVTDLAPIDIPEKKFPGAARVTGEEHLGEALKAFGPTAGEKVAAIIATPPESHTAIAIECVSRGINVLIEKPVADISPKVTDHVYKVSQLDLTARSKNLTAMVAYNYRFSKGYQNFLLELKKASEVYSIYSYYGNKAAAHSREGLLSRTMIHQVNLVRNAARLFLGVENGAEISHHEPELFSTNDDASLTLETRLCTTFISSNIASKKRSHFLLAETSNGRIMWDDLGFDEDIVQMNRSMMSHFISCCDFGTPPETGVHDALIDVRLLKIKQ